MAQWHDAIRSIHEQHFGDPWQERLVAINQRFGLSGDNVFLTHGQTVPPPWFNGDIEAVRPGDWVLMVSLNPRVIPSEVETIRWYDNQGFTAETYWAHWRRFNTNHWYWKFFRPRVRLASRLMGKPVTPNLEPLFATEQMIFVELCPYGSGSFKPSQSMVEELATTDEGFKIAAVVRRLLIERGKPHAIVVNGNLALGDFEALERDRFTWDELRYESVESLSGRSPGRMLWHRQGHYHVNAAHKIPVFGCPFLKSTKGPNSNAEIDDLADRIRAFIRSEQFSPDLAL